MSINIEVLKERVNEIGTDMVRCLTGYWPTLSGGIMTRDVVLLGPATLRGV